MEKLKELPIGVQNFEKLRTGNYLYVDKTEYVYNLAKTCNYVFLSRPRRFGKSMLISTLLAYFEGKKELFDGLAISELEHDWIKYPVLHLDLNQVEKYDEDGLRKVLNDTLVTWEELYGKKESEQTLGLRFTGVIRRAAEKTGHKVAILIDEYDKPLLQTINNDDLQGKIRAVLKSFYSTLKSADQYIQFAFLTGVTKFSKVSIFSDLNNLKDISMRRDYDAICGITDKEIDTVLVPYVKRMAENQEEPMDDVRERLRTYYDGYHFSKNSVALYNPFSLLNALDACSFENYWFETGTPTFLIELLKAKNFPLNEINDIEASKEVLSNIDNMETDPIGIFFQSGYLTIKGYDPHLMGGTYTVGFPNKEVENGFMSFLVPYYIDAPKVKSDFYFRSFIKDVLAGETENFLTRLQSFFADTNYSVVENECERHYQNTLYIICKLMGLDVQAEYHTSRGRIDMLLQTDKYVYVMEFKFNGTAEEALQQINDKSYALPFEAGNRKVIKIGLNFSNKERNIESWVVE